MLEHARRRPEDCIQRAVCQHLRTRGSPGLVWWHTPNGGKRRTIEAAIMKGLGVRAGVSDLIAVHEGKAFALELRPMAVGQPKRSFSLLTTFERPAATQMLPKA